MALVVSSKPSSPSPFGALFSRYDIDNPYDEMFDAVGPAARALPTRCSTICARRRQPELAPAPDRGRQGVPDAGHHLHGLRRRSRAPSASSRSTCCRASSPRAEWRTLERGLTQRLTAINLFLKDVYHEGRILAEGVVPRELVYSCRHYRREMRGVARAPRHLRVGRRHRSRPARRRPVRRARGQPARAERRLVHARQPRGDEARVSRAVRSLQRARRSRTTARRCWPRCARWRRRHVADPTFVVLTPGVGNSAYFEHAFLAREMGVRARRGPRPARPRQHRLHADDGRAAARGRDLPARRRRLPRSAGVPDRLAPRRGRAVQRLSRRQRVARQRDRHRLADDKALYAYIPAIIRFYLSEEPILPNVETYLLGNPSDRQYVLEHLDSLVVKAVGESGGYGMLIGPHSTARGARGVPRQDSGRPAQLHRAADAVALARAVLHRRAASSRATSTCGPYVLFGDTRHDRARRPDARGAAERLARRQLVAGRRQQGHLGAARTRRPCCCHASPTRSTGSAAISSAPSTPRG